MLSLHSFPRAILHIDGDCFFAACEVAQNPELRGKCVITGKERGIAASMSYEAKARGVTRGMMTHEIKKLIPDAILLPSDYETYSIYSKRMFDIVRRYTPEVEEYSIDECFADLTGLRRTLRMSYPEMAEKIKEDMERELGITFSVGLAPSKTLAKVASKWKKPNGLTIIPAYLIHEYLKRLKIGKIWGIGNNTEEYLNKHGIQTALDFVNMKPEWIMAHLTKPHRECWQELRGKAIFELDTEVKHDYQTIQKVKTFTPSSNDKNFVFSQLSKNVENACIKLRRHNLVTDLVYFFLKTQEYDYSGKELKLSHPVNIPHIIMKLVKEQFDSVFDSKIQYRATGVTFAKLINTENMQLDLFQETSKINEIRKIYKEIDKMNVKYGKHSVFMGSSLMAKLNGNHLNERGDIPQRQNNLLKGETKRQRLHLPLLGNAN
jgi:DNA polymerase IV